MLSSKFINYSKILYSKIKIELSKIKSTLENGSNIRNEKLK
jgi:hypothetical protein